LEQVEQLLADQARPIQMVAIPSFLQSHQLEEVKAEGMAILLVLLVVQAALVVVVDFAKQRLEVWVVVATLLVLLRHKETMAAQGIHQLQVAEVAHRRLEQMLLVLLVAMVAMAPPHQ
jgi:O-antigen ligase